MRLAQEHLPVCKYLKHNPSIEESRLKTLAVLRYSANQGSVDSKVPSRRQDVAILNKRGLDISADEQYSCPSNDTLTVPPPQLQRDNCQVACASLRAVDDVLVREMDRVRLGIHESHGEENGRQSVGKAEHRDSSVDRLEGSELMIENTDNGRAFMRFEDGLRSSLRGDRASVCAHVQRPLSRANFASGFTEVGKSAARHLKY